METSMLTTNGSPCGTRRKNLAQLLMDQYLVSELTTCSFAGLSRTAYRYLPLPRDDEAPLRAEVIRMAST